MCIGEGLHSILKRRQQKLGWEYSRCLFSEVEPFRNLFNGQKIETYKRENNFASLVIKFLIRASRPAVPGSTLNVSNKFLKLLSLINCRTLLSESTVQKAKLQLIAHLVWRRNTRQYLSPRSQCAVDDSFHFRRDLWQDDAFLFFLRLILFDGDLGDGQVLPQTLLHRLLGSVRDNSASTWCGGGSLWTTLEELSNR